MFDARQAARDAETVYRPWPFLDMEGNTHHIPHPLMIDPGIVAGHDVDRMDPEQLFNLIAPAAADAMRAMPAAVQKMLVEAWGEQVRADMQAASEAGKELSPSSPTTAPAKRSKRTYPPAASTSTRSSSGRSPQQAKSF